MIEFFSSDIWQGIQGLIAVIALIISLTSPRKFLLEKPNTKWIVKIPWTWLLIIAGVVTGISIGIKFQNTYLGLFVAFAISAVGLGIQWLQTYLLLSRFQVAFDQLTYQYYDLIKIIGRQQNVKFTLSNWNISHTVYENGDGMLREEVTILPKNEPVIYYFVDYEVDIQSQEVTVTAEIINNEEEDPIPLSVHEVESSNKSKTFMIILDPPSTIQEPQRISIVCKRAGIWRKLIEHYQDEGTILTPIKIDAINFEVFAPRDTKWKALSSTVGDKKIEMFGSFSRATWKIKRPNQKRIRYKLFLQREDKKVSI